MRIREVGEKEKMGREMGREKGKGRGGEEEEKAKTHRLAGRLREQRWGMSRRNQRDRAESRAGGDREKPMGMEPKGTRDGKVRNRMRDT